MIYLLENKENILMAGGVGVCFTILFNVFGNCVLPSLSDILVISYLSYYFYNRTHKSNEEVISESKRKMEMFERFLTTVNTQLKSALQEIEEDEPENNIENDTDSVKIPDYSEDENIKFMEQISEETDKIKKQMDKLVVFPYHSPPNSPPDSPVYVPRKRSRSRSRERECEPGKPHEFKKKVTGYDDYDWVCKHCGWVDY